MKRQSVYQTAFCSALFVAIFLTAAQAAGLGGTWSGQVTQNDPPATYPVEMNLYGAVGNIGYPSLGCGGNLEFLRADETTFWYREHLTYGRDKCIDGGTIQMRGHPLGGNTDWIWQWDGAGVSARGVLRGSGTRQ